MCKRRRTNDCPWRKGRRLNALIPDYNGHLDKTTGKYDANKKALDEYIKSLVKKYEVEGAKAKLEEIGGELAGLRIQRSQAQKEYDDAKMLQYNILHQTGLADVRER